MMAERKVELHYHFNHVVTREIRFDRSNIGSINFITDEHVAVNEDDTSTVSGDSRPDPTDNIAALGSINSQEHVAANEDDTSTVSGDSRPDPTDNMAALGLIDSQDIDDAENCSRDVISVESPYWRNTFQTRTSSSSSLDTLSQGEYVDALEDATPTAGSLLSLSPNPPSPPSPSVSFVGAPSRTVSRNTEEIPNEFYNNFAAMKADSDRNNEIFRHMKGALDGNLACKISQPLTGQSGNAFKRRSPQNPINDYEMNPEGAVGGNRAFRISQSCTGQLGDVSQPNSTQNVMNDHEMNPEEWTELSENVFMYHKERYRPHVDIYLGRQRHVSGMHDVIVKLLEDREKNAEEIAILLKIGHHANIVKILASGKCKALVPSRIFVVMELCLKNLDQYICDHNFDLLRAKSFFRQTVLAIVFIHENHITHRDLKPSNILISLDKKNVKVSDFGISKQLADDRSDITVTHAGAGTEGFKAPELYLATKEVGYKVDVFSLGICGYYILTHGKHPFGPDRHKWVGNITDNKNCDLSGIPFFYRSNDHNSDRLIAIFQRMLQHDPRTRPKAEQIRNDAFFEDESR